MFVGLAQLSYQLTPVFALLKNYKSFRIRFRAKMSSLFDHIKQLHFDQLFTNLVQLVSQPLIEYLFLNVLIIK
jgi:hypothetical protein